jgi:hypothetical protein
MLVVLAHEEPHPVAVPENVALDKLTLVTAVAHRSVDPLWHLNLVLPTGEQLCETWVPLGPHRPGSRPSPTSGSGLLEDPPTCQWAQPT